MSLLDLVDSADNTLFAFDDNAGTQNAGFPGALKTFIAEEFQLEAPPLDIEVFESLSPGGRVVYARDGLVESSFRFRVIDPPASPSALVDGVRYVAGLIRRGGILRWSVPGAPVVWIDFEPSPATSLWRGETRGLFKALKLVRDIEGLPVIIHRQPYLRGAEVTVGPTSISNNPASAGGRAISLNVSGDAPTPAIVLVKADAGSRVMQAITGAKPMTATDATDYTGETKFAQAEATGGGWTVALSGDTTSVADPAEPGTNVAQTAYTTNPTVWQRRVRITRTTKLSSLAGLSDVCVRVKASAASQHEIQLRWAPSLADPVTFSNEVITHDIPNASAFGYVLLHPGYIDLSADAPVIGLALELWSRRVSGSGSLSWDYVSLVPAVRSAELAVLGGSPESWLGSDLATPSTAITGDPAWTAGTVLGTTLKLTALNQAGGVPPNTGLVWPVGRHTITYTLSAGGSYDGTTRLRIVDITNGSVVQSIDVTKGTGTFSRTTIRPGSVKDFSLSFDSVAATSYQPQAAFTARTSGAIHVHDIHHTFVPYLTATEQMRTNAETGAAETVDTSGNLLEPLSVSGPIPYVLDPGHNVIALAVGDIPLAGYSEPEDVLTRVPTITVRYKPRFYT